MKLDRTMYIALFAALVNVVLSHIVPCAISSENQGMIREIRDEFSRNKSTIVVSSVVIGIIVYIALNYEKDFRTMVPAGLVNFN